MIKTTKTKTFDTDTATAVKKVVSGVFGDPAGYEMTMYLTPEGDYFLYTYGGPESEYKTEKITSYTKNNAKKWLEEN